MHISRLITSVRPPLNRHTRRWSQAMARWEAKRPAPNPSDHGFNGLEPLESRILLTVVVPVETNQDINTAFTSGSSDQPGDVNGDGGVDNGDFGVVLANFGLTPATRADGDLDGNGLVDNADFGQVLANFGVLTTRELADALVADLNAMLVLINDLIDAFEELQKPLNVELDEVEALLVTAIDLQTQSQNDPTKNAAELESAIGVGDLRSTIVIADRGARRSLERVVTTISPRIDPEFSDGDLSDHIDLVRNDFLVPRQIRNGADAIVDDLGAMQVLINDLTDVASAEQQKQLNVELDVVVELLATAITLQPPQRTQPTNPEEVLAVVERDARRSLERVVGIISPDANPDFSTGDLSDHIAQVRDDLLSGVVPLTDQADALVAGMDAMNVLVGRLLVAFPEHGVALRLLQREMAPLFIAAFRLQAESQQNPIPPELQSRIDDRDMEARSLLRIIVDTVEPNNSRDFTTGNLVDHVNDVSMDLRLGRHSPRGNPREMHS